MNGRELSGRRRTNHHGAHRDWRLLKAVRLRSMCLALLCVTIATGCQATHDCGLLRVWADVNSLGGPAAFVDQNRTDGFRTAAPETGLAEVRTMDVEVSPYDVGATQYEQFPAFDPVDDPMKDAAINDAVTKVENISHDSARAVRVSAEQSVHQNQLPVVPAGAWLF